MISQAKNWKSADTLNAPFGNQMGECQAKLTFSSSTVLLVRDLDIVFNVNDALEGGCTLGITYPLPTQFGVFLTIAVFIVSKAKEFVRHEKLNFAVMRQCFRAKTF